jgi:hypothetical protein
MVMSAQGSDDFWEKAVQELHKFNSVYAAVEKKPNDPVVLRKSVTAISKLVNFQVWVKKCLTKESYADFLEAAKDIFRLTKDKSAAPSALLAGIEAYKMASQRALDSAAPESFTYQGFKVINKQHFADELCRKALQGLDYLKALFKKRGVINMIESGVARVVLVNDANATAYFHSGTREMVISVEEITKGSARILDDFANETILHEFGHYVHRNYITGEAEEAWNSPWGDLPSLADPRTPKRPDNKRQEQLDPLEIVTEYGKVDKYEDFAETFVVFMAAPEKLTPTAKFRMQRALSLSGLYGKPVLRLSTSILRVASRALQAKPELQQDTYDTQMAITQILLRNKWEQGIGGRIIKKVKSTLQSSPKIYVLDVSKDGLLLVKDRDGRVSSKVVIKPHMSNSEIMAAARTLNDGAAKLVMADDDETVR